MNKRDLNSRIDHVLKTSPTSGEEYWTHRSQGLDDVASTLLGEKPVSLTKSAGYARDYLHDLDEGERDEPEYWDQSLEYGHILTGLT